MHLGGKDVLSKVSGEAAAGQVLAVMGASGGGKTTLLNALSRRGPVTGGTVTYGEPGELWSSRLRKKVAYVEQDDQVYTQLTVYETLHFAAALRLPALTPEEREVNP